MSKLTPLKKSKITNGNEKLDKMPKLESAPVSQAIKERYEYNPVLRSEIIYVLPEDRRCSEIMSRLEECEVVSIRAAQIESGSPIFTDIGFLIDPLEIARKEIKDKRCPLSIIRHIIPDVLAEKWAVNELANFNE